jgi:hypothetical protein
MATIVLVITGTIRTSRPARLVEGSPSREPFRLWQICYAPVFAGGITVRVAAKAGAHPLGRGVRQRRAKLSGASPVHRQSSCFLRRGRSRSGYAQFLDAYSTFQKVGRSYCEAVRLGYMAIIMRLQCKRQKFFGVASQLVRGHALPQPDSLFIVVSVPDIERKMLLGVTRGTA